MEAIWTKSFKIRGKSLHKNICDTCIRLKTFRTGYVIIHCGVVVRWSRVEQMVRILWRTLSFFILSYFFFVFGLYIPFLTAINSTKLKQQPHEVTDRWCRVPILLSTPCFFLCLFFFFCYFIYFGGAFLRFVLFCLLICLVFLLLCLFVCCFFFQFKPK